MDALALARLQFATTSLYHFFFVPLTLGLSIIVALMETLYVSSGNETYKRMTRFWGKLFVINFAMGVVTGIVQEFEFGMNWSQYARFVGDVFGAPLAIEALAAFFLESTFLGVWIFGWNKVSPKAHLAAIWLVAFASNMSAFWILVANSFMQQPVGYVLRNGRAEMNDFLALIFNPNVQVQFPHVFAGGLATGAFFVMGISAWHLLRGSQVDQFRRSMQIGATFGIIAVMLVILNGHTQAQHMVEIQPMKMAAAEGLFETQDPASFSLLTIGDPTGRRELFSLRVPNALSLLAYNQLTGEVKGINALQAEYAGQYGPGDYVPPTWPVYWSFRVMVGAGFAMLALAGYALFLGMGDMLEGRPRLLALFPLAIPLPYLANMAGWIMAEVGRAPWVVFGVMRLEDAVTPTIGVPTLLISLAAIVVVYTGLVIADIYLLTKVARAGVRGVAEVEGPAGAPARA